VFLDGVRVIDFSTLLPGPYCTLRLADLGAEVIKVEPPEGDPARSRSCAIHGTGVVFLANNRNKQSVCIDLKSASGQRQAHELLRTADVVVEGFRPGVTERLGIDYEVAKTLNSAVVYCSLTGYGQSGPLAEFAGHDLNYMARSGMLSQLRDAAGRSIVPTIQWADLLGGTVAAEEILAALVRRQRTGEGAYLDVAMTDALMGMQHIQALAAEEFGVETGVKELTGSLVCYSLYETRDDRLVSLAALEEKFWRIFCESVAKPGWISYQFTLTTENNPVYGEMKKLFKAHDLAFWTRFGERTDCCLQPVLHTSEAMQGEHARVRGIAFDLETALWGNLRQVATHSTGTPGVDKREAMKAPPQLGNGAAYDPG